MAMQHVGLFNKFYPKSVYPLWNEKYFYWLFEYVIMTINVIGVSNLSILFFIFNMIHSKTLLYLNLHNFLNYELY